MDDMDKQFELHHGDCLDVLKGMADWSVDAIVTDPPYGLGFMGKHWDHGVPGVDFWVEMLRVLKPGGHLLAFSGSRTYHRMACAIEDAGFDVRDQIMWVYGSGFPKSLDVSKAIEDAKRKDITPPSTKVARQWQGWGTALKPAHEPICVARKPLIGTVAENVLAHGVGAINIDGCRVPSADGVPLFDNRNGDAINAFGDGLSGSSRAGETGGSRWPANIIHDGSEEVVGLFPVAPGQQGGITGYEPSGKMGAANCYGKMDRRHVAVPRVEAVKSAARFFYCAKASRKDRNEGIGGSDDTAVGAGATMREREDADRSKRNGNHHPTVKPTNLMAYLCRLVTPPAGIVLDPFMGSGSTGKAAIREGFRFVGIERESEYLQIAQSRIEAEVIGVTEERSSGAQMPLF